MHHQRRPQTPSWRGKAKPDPGRFIIWGRKHKSYTKGPQGTGQTEAEKNAIEPGAGICLQSEKGQEYVHNESCKSN